MTDEELREFMRDVIAELRELRRLVAHPSAQDRAARLYLRLAALLDADDAFFKKEDVFGLARNDAELTAALEALGLSEPNALAYFFRSRAGRAIAGYCVLRSGRGWRMQMAGPTGAICTDSQE
jgi:hypothetical protein